MAQESEVAQGFGRRLVELIALLKSPM